MGFMPKRGVDVSKCEIARSVLHGYTGWFGYMLVTLKCCDKEIPYIYTTIQKFVVSDLYFYSAGTH